MANISINAGITYRFARADNKTVILGSDDNSHAVRTIANQLVVSGTNVPSTAVDIFVDTSGHARIRRPAVGSSTPMFQLNNPSIDGYCSMFFDGLNEFTMGTYNNAS